jgi:putative hydrolase of the HAD superfamily
MRILAESPVCAVTREVFSPDYSILENPSHHSVFISAIKSGKRFLISEEELGNNGQKGGCLYDVCPTPSTYAMVRPVFLIRDPIRVFDSWKNVGWTDEQSLIDCYTNIYRMLHQAPAHSVSCLLYEHLIQDPQTEVARICAQRGVPFSETMLYFKQPFGHSFIFSTDRKRSIYLEEKPLGLFTIVEASSSVEIDVPYHDLLSNIEKGHIEERLGRRYIQCWQDDILRIRAILAEKTWVGFDLDDSSGTATNKVLEEISERYGTPTPALKDEYSRVLKTETANAFSDGKTSFDYRKERFALVLAHFSLPQDDQFMAELLGSYEATLLASLQLKCGALGLLSAVRKMGKKIGIMTEGPQDGQERTVQGLGIAGYIDFLATTNHFRVTKTSGLFSKVLEHLGVSPGDMAYVGDNELRDMKPAMAEGIFSIHLAETKHVSLNTFPPQINTLRKLQYILSDDGS